MDLKAPEKDNCISVLIRRRKICKKGGRRLQKEKHGFKDKGGCIQP